MLKDREAYNAYMRGYLLDRYHQRRRYALKKLGGKCARCGSSKKLDLDHIDPRTKCFAIGKYWSVSAVKFEAELSKCQLLCKRCHNEKSITERGYKVARGTHGTLSSYRYCKCPLCKAAKSASNRIQAKRRKRWAGNSTGRVPGL